MYQIINDKSKIKGQGWFKFKPYNLALLISIFLFSCQDFVEVDTPQDELVAASVFKDEASAQSVVTGIYSRMMSSLGYASGFYDSVTVLAGLYTDELDSYISPNSFYENTLTPNEQAVGLHFWNEPYAYIYTCNLVLEKLGVSDNLDSTVKNQLEGEVRFIRAFCYFYLVNSFGDVPLYLTSDYRENSKGSRTPSSDIYKQITQDLEKASALLPEDYSDYNNERIRPNKYASTALLARVSLYMEDWVNAEKYAGEVISQTGLYGLENDLNSVFLKNSNEAIWQLQPVYPGFNTLEGYWFIATSAPPYTVGLSEFVVDAFEIGDNRLEQWVGSVSDGEQNYYFPYKYKVQFASTITEYSMIMRLAEQYLIRAEARAQQNKTAEAQSDLNLVRNRAGLDDTSAATVSELLDAIYHERQVELFTEWGHRFFDLKRTGRIDDVLSTRKANWDSYEALLPIPLDETLRNPKITQNPGY